MLACSVSIQMLRLDDASFLIRRRLYNTLELLGDFTFVRCTLKGSDDSKIAQLFSSTRPLYTFTLVTSTLEHLELDALTNS